MFINVVLLESEGLNGLNAQRMIMTQLNLFPVSLQPVAYADLPTYRSTLDGIAAEASPLKLLDDYRASLEAAAINMSGLTHRRFYPETPSGRLERIAKALDTAHPKFRHYLISSGNPATVIGYVGMDEGVVVMDELDSHMYPHVAIAFMTPRHKDYEDIVNERISETHIEAIKRDDESRQRYRTQEILRKARRGLLVDF